ncbi:GAF domain-containing DNA-binding protein [Rariglobus hedericola]|uniref:GAF domain-containing protein n=1 Tax=Rariglobus hedericola TaxID=2597822 RepID=A0A556QK64_9BACT|nr:GAF domain-containing DNA-binding protein [Rariglobus hedericola]TSJ77019.1 GAF domain-containing protein [Rariglobus hedericola]
MPRKPPASFCELFDLRSDAIRSDDPVYAASLALLTRPFDDAVSAILETAGLEASADRAWLFSYNEEITLFRNTHEWHRPGVPSFVTDLQNTPVAMIAWLHAHLLREQAVLVHDIRRLPRSARALRAEFLRQQNQSVLSVPLFLNGRLWGCIGFDAVRKPVYWSAQIVQSLQLCGNLIAAAASPVAQGEPRSSPPPAANLYLRGSSALQRVSLDNIVGVQAERDYTRVHLADGRSFLELRPLNTWVSLLPHDRFQQIHRSSLVRVASILDVERTTRGLWQVCIEGVADKWAVSKRYRADLRSRLGA